MRLVTDAARPGFGVYPHDKIEIVMFRRPLAKLEHFREFVSRVDMQDGKRNTSEESLACKPDENVRVLPHRPRHGDVLERVIRLAKNKNALVLEFVEMCASYPRHGVRILQRVMKLATDEHRFTQIHFSGALSVICV